MKHSKTLRLFVVAAILLAGAQALTQTPVDYRCRRPKTGSPAVAYRWYICRPDSNTLIFQITTSETFATIVHEFTGEHVRVEAVDAENHVGQPSVASDSWVPNTLTGIPQAAVARLLPNYPNPFNSATTIPFTLPQPLRTRLTIYDLAGRVVRVLVDAVEPAGKYEARWDGTSDRGQQVASGVYICRMEAGSFRDTRRMTLVK